jgi:hypothetical protein
MPKRKEPELTPKKQFEEFVKTAREHEVDETGKEFEQAFERIVRQKKDGSKSKS